MSLARALPAAALLALAAGAAGAQTVTFNGAMGGRALLVIDGTPRTLAPGASVQGIKLLSVADGEAQVEIAGRAVPLRLGAPVSLGAPAGSGSGGGSGEAEIVLTAGPGGHFLASGGINGRAVQFMVDTGATTVAIGEAEAQRLGLAYRQGQPVTLQTANGTARGYLLKLDRVRVGGVEVYSVDAVVSPLSMPYVLLGNSFLSRFQLRRDNDVMRLIKKP